MTRTQITLDPPIDLGGGALFRLGARIPTEGRLSWVPAGVTEPFPLNVYVLTSEQRAIVVDTGPLVLYPQLLEQIRTVVGDRELAILVTRNDPEAMGGVGSLLPQLAPSVFYYYGGGSILEWVWDERDGPGASGDLFDTVPVDSPTEIALEGDRIVQIIRPPLAVLNTVWVYDPTSKTLFTSDGLGYLPSDQPADSVVDDRGDVDADRTRAFISARFDWIARLNSTRLADELHELLQPLEIENLAPSHGVVVRGAAAVDCYLQTVLECLRPEDPGVDELSTAGTGGR